MNIILNQRITLDAPQGIISEVGIAEITMFIQRQTLQSDEWKALNPAISFMYLPSLPGEWQWTWVITGKGEYVGTFPKRVSKFYYKVFGIRCPKTFLEQLGNIARAHSESSQHYEFEFVSQFNWRAGDFGDSGSCYFGSHSSALEMLESNGGLAMRFYNEAGNGLARAWVVSVETDLYIVFNGYGFHTDATLVIARVLALHLNLSYKRIDLDNNSETSGTLWINGGRGYAVGTAENLQTLHSWDLEWDDPYAMRCEECNDPLGEDDTYYSPDGLPYCYDCFHARFEDCSRCGEPHYHDEITPTQDGEYVCQRCLDRYYTRCEECGEWVRDGAILMFEDKPYCEDCYPHTE